MARLIDANAMHKPIYAKDDNITGYGMTQDERDSYNEGIRYALRLVANCPTVDAVEVQHAYWTWDGYDYEKPLTCTNCRCHSESETKYCPNCGAKMDGGVNNAASGR